VTSTAADKYVFRAAPDSADFLFEAKELLFSAGPFCEMLPVFSGKTFFALYGSDRLRTEQAVVKAASP
jgi:hypothetical protein